jgi:hypothetical protein
MTAEALVARLRERGVTLRPDGDQLVVSPVSAVQPDELEALRQMKPAVMQMLRPPQLPLLPGPGHVDAYRDALRECWRLMALGPDADAAACHRAMNELFKLEDEVGEPRASELRRQWEIEWHRETGRCPRCGEVGERPHNEDDR